MKDKISKYTPFVEYITDKLQKSGLNVNSCSSFKGGLHLLNALDAVYNTAFVVIAKRNRSKDAHHFWKEVTDKLLVKMLAKNTSDDGTAPVLFILPSDEAHVLAEELSSNMVRVNHYNLFDGFSVLGMGRKEAHILLLKRIHAMKKNKDVISSLNIERRKNTVVVKSCSGVLKKAVAAVFVLLMLPAAISYLYFNRSIYNEYAKEMLSTAVYGSKENKVRVASIAENAPLSQYDMYYLAKQGYKENIAKNPRLKNYTMQKFAADKDPAVRASLALNPSLTGDIAEKLTKDSSARVRANAARYTGLSHETLTRLSKDKEYSVREGVLQNPGLNEQMLDTIVPNISTASCETKELLYSRNGVYAEELNYNLTNPDPCVRRGIAKNLNSRPDIIETLLKDKDSKVFFNALSNPNINIQTLQRLNKQYFSGGWEKDVDPHNAKIRTALLQNTANRPLPKTVDALYNNEEYDSIYIDDSALGDKGNLNGLLNTSLSKGGLKKFTDDINSMPVDNKLIAGLAAAAYESGISWEDRLRKKVNNSFAENIYDPVAVAQILSDKDLHEDNKDIKKLSLYDIEDEGEFFSAKDIDAANAVNIDTFTEFYDNNILTKHAEQVLATADGIIDEVMESLVPVMDARIQSYHEHKQNGDVTTFILNDLKTPLDRDFYFNTVQKLEELGKN